MAHENRRLQVNGAGTYPDSIRVRIATTQAVDVLNCAIRGEPYGYGERSKPKPVTQIQLKAALAAINKFVPDLQAVAIDVNDKRPTTIEDINSRMAMLGMNSEQVWSMITSPPKLIEGDQVPTEPDPEKSDSRISDSEAPHTPK